MPLDYRRTTTRLRSGAAKATVLAVSALTLLLSAAAASAATTHVPQLRASVRAASQVHGAPSGARRPAGLAWHKLTLLNGWTDGEGSERTPSYAIGHGVVYLSGSLSQPVSGSDVFAELPKSVRPSHTLYVAVYAGYGGFGTLLIDPDGMMQAYSNPSGAAATFTSLGGVSYPIAGVTWHKLHLINGWKSAQASYHTGTPAYAIKGGVVYISGSMLQPAGAGKLFAVLPRSARPGRQIDHLVYAYGGLTAGLTIGSNGSMRMSERPQSNARAFSSLAAISYPVARTRWHKLTLLNKWKPGPTALGYPAYAVVSGVVFLSGSVVNASLGNPTKFADALKLQPDLGEIFLAYTTGGHAGDVYVGEDDEAYMHKARYFVALSGMSCPRSA